MSGESFYSLLIVELSLRNDSSKSKGSPFVRFVLLPSLLETKETNLKGFSLFSTYCCILFRADTSHDCRRGLKTKIFRR